MITTQSTNLLWQRQAQSYYFPLQIVPNKAGEFLIRNLLPGQISLDARFFARYWFLHSLAFPPQVPPRSTTNEVVGNASNQILVKSGDRITGIKIVFAEGATSVEGRIELDKGEQIPEGLHFTLVPAEPENRDNLLRFFFRSGK